MRIAAIFLTIGLVLSGCSHKTASTNTTHRLSTTSTTSDQTCGLISSQDIVNIVGEDTLPTTSKDDSTGATLCLFSRKLDPGTLVVSVELEPSSLEFYLYKKSQKIKTGDAQQITDAALEGYFDSDVKTLSVLVGNDRVLAIKEHVSRSLDRVKTNAEKLAQIAVKNLGAESTPGTVPDENGATSTSLSQTDRTQIEQDVISHVQLINSFWQGQFSSNPTLARKGKWNTVSKINALSHFAKASCGFGGGSLVTNNAFYCGVDNSVTYDEGWFTKLVSQDPNQTTVWTVLAHELGHAVQNDANLSFERSAPLEQQADCFAGVFISTQNAAGKTNIDKTAAADFLASLGDPAGVSENNPQAHGSPDDRRAAIQLGLNGSAQTCIDSFH